MTRLSTLPLIVAILLTSHARFAAAETAAGTGGEQMTMTDSTFQVGAMPQQAMQACAECDTCEVGPWFAGAEYRYLRTHFSEAIAFAEVTDSITGLGFTRQVEARELSFDYESSFRMYFGSHIDNYQDIRFAYWYLDDEVNVNGVAAPGVVVVDPFGNIALPGMNIDTQASINLNVVDLEYLQTMTFNHHNVEFMYSAGLRFAEIEQNYTSVIRAGGNVITSGVFDADFSGIGPYLSLTGSTFHGPRKQLSLVAKGAGGLLVGDYEVESGATITGIAAGGQSASRIRMVPVLESELGAAWRPSDRVTVTAGWFFSAWFSLGTSGGGFSGQNLPVAPMTSVFSQTDDSDIMSFDGLFVRAEVWF